MTDDPITRALDAIDGIQAITRSVRTFPRHGVTDSEARLYDKGYDDALDQARAALRIAFDAR